MKRIVVTGMIAVLFIFSLDGCAKGKPATHASGNTDATPLPTPSNPESSLVTLRQGQATSLPQHPDDALTFVDVPQDSRCPIGGQCIWEGDATVVLVVSQAGTSDTTRIELHTSSRFATSGTYKGLNIHLQKVDPHPKLGTVIQLPDYVATLAIARQ